MESLLFHEINIYINAFLYLFFFFFLPSIEREVLKRKDVIEKEQKLAKITDPVELHNKSVAYMKEMTGADEDTCILKLESNGYNLKESLAAVRR